MTTQFISRCCGLFVSILLISSSFAQVSEFKDLQQVLTKGGYVKVYENVLTEFHNQFSGAENVRWSKIDKNFLAQFTNGDLNQMVLLNTKGEPIYKISYGKEKHLPVTLRKEVKRNYVEFFITAAIFVEQDNRRIWIINLEDDSHCVTLRVEKLQMEEVRKYKKI